MTRTTVIEVFQTQMAFDMWAAMWGEPVPFSECHGYPWPLTCVLSLPRLKSSHYIYARFWFRTSWLAMNIIFLGTSWWEKAMTFGGTHFRTGHNNLLHDVWLCDSMFWLMIYFLSESPQITILHTLGSMLSSLGSLRKGETFKGH